jgi:hypothetical protein
LSIDLKQELAAFGPLALGEMVVAFRGGLARFAQLDHWR